MFTFENELIKLRAVEPTDLELLYSWENDPEVWGVSGTIVPFSRHQIEQYIASEGDVYANKQLRLMIDAKSPDGKDAQLSTVGCIDLYDFEPFHARAGIGILTYSNEQRCKGYAGSAVSLLVHYAFHALDLHQLYCYIGLDNKGSLACMQKNEFEITGLRKQWNRTPNGWEDQYMLQRIRE